MAVMKGGNRQSVGPSLKGLYYEYERQGQWIASAMPPKRPGPGSALQERAKKLFSDACKAMKAMDPSIIAYAMENAKGTPMLPRDVMLINLNGRGPVFYFKDGERRFSMAARIDLSELLDMIASTPGALMYRATDDLWRGIAVGAGGQQLQVTPELMPAWVDPLGTGFGDGSMLIRADGSWVELSVGDPSYVLSVSNDGTAPEWQSPTSQGLGLHWMSGSHLVISPSAFASKGVGFTPALDCHLEYMAVEHDCLSDDVIRMDIVELAGETTITAILASWAPVLVQDDVTKTERVQAPFAVSLTGGVNYAILFTTTNKATTYTNKLQNSNEFFNSFPLNREPSLLRATNINPVVGTVFARVASNPFAISFALS